jgi:hypothetical protein
VPPQAFNSRFNWPRQRRGLSFVDLSGVDLLEVPRGCGVERVMEVEDEAGLKELAGLLLTSDRTLFAHVSITPDDPPRVLPEKDGVAIKDRVRRAALSVA